MKEIQAFIRPEKLTEVYQALRESGYCCMTVFDGEGTGKYTDPKENWPSFKFPFMHSKVVKIEMVCPPEYVDEVVETIQEYGSSGQKGDGLIYISQVDEVVRVRDGAKGREILH